MVFLAGPGQRHDVYNAFEILVNDGFLHDQGVLTLEAVQKFYEEIFEYPEEATLIEADLLEFCHSEKSQFRPVVTLMLKDLVENEKYYHAVTLKSFELDSKFLKAKLIDSRAENGEVDVNFPLTDDVSGPEIKLNEKLIISNSSIEKEEWYLGESEGDEMCYYIEFN